MRLRAGQIERNEDGTRARIVAPFGQRTELTLEDERLT